MEKEPEATHRKEAEEKRNVLWPVPD